MDRSHSLLDLLAHLGITTKVDVHDHHTLVGILGSLSNAGSLVIGLRHTSSKVGLVVLLDGLVHTIQAVA